MTRLKSNIILLTASVVVGLVMAEVLLRVFVPQETKRLATFDPDLGWRGVPGGTGTYIRIADGIETEFTYNDIGFRDEDVPPLDPERRQVVMLGDSFVESLEVPLEASFHDLVEQWLRSSVDPAYSVVSLASQGYSTAQELLAYRKFRDRLAPRVVLVVFYTGNDFTDNSNTPFIRIDERDSLVFISPEYSQGEKMWLAFQRWAYERSHLVFFLKNAAENLLNTRITHEARGVNKRAKGVNSIRVEMTSRLLRQICSELAAEQVKVGVVVIPSRADMLKDRHEPSDFVGEVCRLEGIPYMRLDTLLRPDHYFEHDEHLNIEGHRVASRAIMDFLSTSFELKATAPDERPS
jgi:lysophospholipase L1-like esterase